MERKRKSHGWSHHVGLQVRKGYYRWKEKKNAQEDETSQKESLSTSLIIIIIIIIPTI